MELDVSLGFVHPATAFPFEAAVTLPPQNLGGETVAFDGVTLQGVYQVAGGVVVLEGRLATVAHAACARCAAPAQAVVETAFRETFRKDANETQDESFRYEGKSVPLDQMALTLVLLNLPMRFSCARPDCRPAAELTAWDEDGKTWSDAGAEATYRPFDGLDAMMQENGKERPT